MVEIRMLDAGALRVIASKAAAAGSSPVRRYEKGRSAGPSSRTGVGRRIRQAAGDRSPAESAAVRLMRSVHVVHQEKFEPREHLEPVPSSSAALRSSEEGLRWHLASRRDRG
jgi:hypothetical protein